MKKWLLLGVLALALTGCSSDKLSEQEYYDLVHETAGLSGMDNADIKTNGENTCAVFDEIDEPYPPALGAMIDGGLEAGDAGALIAYSVAQYCPEHLNDIPTP
jgi:hypothetical protein